MPSAELTSTRRARQAAAIPEGVRLRGQLTVGGQRADVPASGHPDTVTGGNVAASRTDRGRGRAAVRATGQWLLHALAELARSWALAAGVPPDQYP